jgi:hypothetical protein
MEIYGNPRGGAAREPCIDFAAAKNTVRVFGVGMGTFIFDCFFNQDNHLPRDSMYCRARADSLATSVGSNNMV